MTKEFPVTTDTNKETGMPPAGANPKEYKQTLVDTDGKEIPQSLVNEMIAYVKEYRKKNPGCTTGEAMQAVCNKYGVRVGAVKRKGKKDGVLAKRNGSNYTPPKKRRKK